MDFIPGETGGVNGKLSCRNQERHVGDARVYSLLQLEKLRTSIQADTDGDIFTFPCLLVLHLNFVDKWGHAPSPPHPHPGG